MKKIMLAVGFISVLSASVANAASACPSNTFPGYGDGTCSGAKAANGECANLGGYILEICPGTSGAGAKVFPQTVPCSYGNGACSQWIYTVSPQAGSNQFDFLIANAVSVYANGAYSQVYAQGQGDPATNFGIYDLVDTVYRIPFGAGPVTLWTNVTGPDLVAASMKAGTKVYGARILGPGPLTPEQLTTTSKGFTDIKGNSISITTDIQGNATSTWVCPPGSSPPGTNGSTCFQPKSFPINQAQFCLPAQPAPSTCSGTTGSTTYTILPDASNNNASTCYACQATVFQPDGTSLKTGNGGQSDPCLLSGGRYYCY